ncbi:MAG: ATP-binding protein [Thermoplasmata archaeon]|nr:ATP-binding protein [Thermoplasmata archaeon]
MRFYDRVNEMKIIKNAIARPNCFVVVTGRRRIGKTRLIRETLKKIKHIELFIPRKRLTLVMENIQESIQDQTGYAPSLKNFKEVFEYLFRTEKKPVFIDEVSNLDYVENGAFSDLQAIIDKEKYNWGIRLVVDGSYVGVMKKIFMDKNEPLFGRATDLIELQSLPVKDSIKMCMETASFKFKDALEAYSLLGGVPRYIELLSQFKNMKDLVDRIFSPGSIFLTEGENILLQEFGASWETYFSFMEVTAKGKLGPSAIASHLGMPIQMIPKYLENLVKLQLVQRKRPILGKARHVHYCIQDPFFQLWFKICYPKIGQYRDGTSTVPPERIYTAIGKAMERVVMEILGQSKVLPFAPDEVGGWWDRSGHEIDVVMYSKRTKALLGGEVKWANKPVSLEEVEQLLENIKRVDWYNATRKEYTFIVSKSGFTEPAGQLMGIKNVVGLGLNELEKVLFQNKAPKWSYNSLSDGF